MNANYFNETINDANQKIERHIIKRDGSEAVYEPRKIAAAIRKACKAAAEAGELPLTEEQIQGIVDQINKVVYERTSAVTVDDIQEMVEKRIDNIGGHYDLLMRYERYKAQHDAARKKTDLDRQIEGIVEVGQNADGSVSGKNETVKQENANKNPVILSTQRDYIAGTFSRYYTARYLLSDDVKQAMADGVIHFHDSDYFVQKMHNCDLVNLNDMLQNGTVISGVKIDTPKSFSTACTVSSQIVAQVASAQYGGQTITLSHLAPFVDVSRKKIYKRLKEELGGKLSDEDIRQVTEQELRKEVESGCQTIQYQLITLQSTNGQAPFVTVFMYLHEVPEGQIRDDLALIIEVMLKQRILGVKDKSGNYITPAFPKLIYVMQEDNIVPGSRYYYLSELAAKCTAKRMVPDYISEKKMIELKGEVYPCMGCRSFLTPDRFTDAGAGNVANALDYDPGKHKYYGRFNQGVVTLNLPYVALLSGGDQKKFWELLDKYEEICHKALRVRHERLLGTPSDVAPILWQDGALARLKPGETIDKLLYGGYSTISLGYAGLYECTKYMTGESHTSEIGKPFAMAVMQSLNDHCTAWKKAENIDYSVYGTPLESTTYSFAKALQRRFGIIPEVTDHSYITNSYHVCVREKIDAFSKLTFESEFQKLSPGGAISYVEVPNMQNNIPAVLAVMRHIYNTIIYAELNTKSDLCECCGYDGEMKIVEDEFGKLVWECPNCGNRNPQKMHIARRTCGYIGTQGFNQGRTAEIKDRVLHL